MNNSRKPSRSLTSGLLDNLHEANAVEQLARSGALDKLTAYGFLRDEALHRAARGIYSSEIERALANVSGVYDTLEKFGTMRGAVEAAMGRIQNIDSSAFLRAHEAAMKLSTLSQGRFGNPLDDQVAKAIQSIAEPFSGISAGMRTKLGLDTQTFSALSRAQNWAGALTGPTGRDYAELLGIDNIYRKQFEAVSLAAKSILASTSGLAEAIGARVPRISDIDGLGSIAAKMSVFAGSMDVLGPSASASLAAYHSLLGNYSSAAMIERPYWRDPRERARYYREQEVDDDLVDTDNATTVAVLVESGVVEGQLTRTGTLTAIVEAGPVRLRIIASRPKVGAFQAIDAFERELRSYISSKFDATVGPNWFKSRVPGAVVDLAKRRRREAMRNGEAQLSLIHFTELGDLLDIILRKDNWGEMFEVVFDRADGLRVDLSRLNANRRPTMHSRPIDPVQLCEVIFTIRRLVGWMERDGAWDQGWDDDI